LFLLDEQVTKPGDRAGLAPSRGLETNARPFEDARRDKGRPVGRTLNCGGKRIMMMEQEKVQVERSKSYIVGGEEKSKSANNGCRE
jgi:hypothetical protein